MNPAVPPGESPRKPNLGIEPLRRELEEYERCVASENAAFLEGKRPRRNLEQCFRDLDELGRGATAARLLEQRDCESSPRRAAEWEAMAGIAAGLAARSASAAADDAIATLMWGEPSAAESSVWCLERSAQPTGPGAVGDETPHLSRRNADGLAAAERAWVARLEDGAGLELEAAAARLAAFALTLSLSKGPLTLSLSKGPPTPSLSQGPPTPSLAKGPPTPSLAKGPLTLSLSKGPALGAARGWEMGSIATAAEEWLPSLAATLRQGCEETALAEWGSAPGRLRPAALWGLLRGGLKAPLVEAGDATKFLLAVLKSCGLFLPETLRLQPWTVERRHPPRVLTLHLEAEAVPPTRQLRLAWPLEDADVLAAQQLIEAAAAGVAAASTAPLPIELVQGRNQILSRSYRILLGGLLAEPEWLAEIFWGRDVRRVVPAARRTHDLRLFAAACAVIAEAASPAADAGDLADSIAEMWKGYLGFPPPPSYRALPFAAAPAAAETVLAFAFATQWRWRAMSRYGRAWWKDAKAGRELTELFENGGRDTADEVGRALWGGPVEVEALGEEIA